MEAYYLLEVFYPDGHAEEFDEQYNTARDAAEFGLNMLNQISHTEQKHLPRCRSTGSYGARHGRSP